MVDRLPPIAVSASHSQPRQAGLSQKSRLERSKPEAGGGTPVDRGGERRGEGRGEVEKHTRRYTILAHCRSPPWGWDWGHKAANYGRHLLRTASGLTTTDPFASRKAGVRMALFQEHRASSGDSTMLLSPTSKAAIRRAVSSALAKQSPLVPANRGGGGATAAAAAAASALPPHRPSQAHAQALSAADDPAVASFLHAAAHERYAHKQFKALARRQHERECDESAYPRWSMEIAQRRADVNRYIDAIPYDASRVIVKSGLNHRGTVEDDYINASYVSSPRNTRRYIATQGPMENTVHQFWRMVWENVSTGRPETVSTIIMLTRFVEAGIEKCAHYLPRAGQVLDIPYRDGPTRKTLIVRSNEEEAAPESDCVVTTLTLFTRNPHDKAGESPQYQVRHLVYNGWRDMSVPDSAETFLNFFQLFHRYHTSDASPVVHCTAGVGRTGVFIAFDYLFSRALEMSASEIANDPVFETVDELRSWRTLMVCRVSQLEYIYTLFRNIILAEQHVIADESG